MLDHKINLNTLWKPEILQFLFSDQNRVKWKKSTTKEKRKVFKCLKINKFLNNSGVREEKTRKVGKYFNLMKITTIITAFRGKFNDASNDDSRKRK